jgi:hypothetical protein
VTLACQAARRYRPGVAIDIDCTPEETGWRCLVVVSNGERTAHLVDVSEADLERMDPEASEPDRLVRASFEFLLEREPNTAILREFELPEIAGYFPEYEATVRARLAAQASD